MRILRGITLLLAGWFASSAAAADDDAEARRLFEQAAEARSVDDMTRAEELLSRSLLLAPLAPTAFNLAEVRARLGMSCASVALYDELLEGHFGELDAARSSEVTRKRGTTAARTASVRVSIRGVASARLTVDAGEPTRVAGSTTLCLDEGTHRLAARAPGRSVAESRLEVGAGEEHELELRLEQVTSVADESGSVLSEPWLWITVGAVAIAVGVGVGIAVANSGTGELVDPVWGNKVTLRFAP